MLHFLLQLDLLLLLLIELKNLLLLLIHQVVFLDGELFLCFGFDLGCFFIGFLLNESHHLADLFQHKVLVNSEPLTTSQKFELTCF